MIPNETLLKLSSIGLGKYYRWPYKNEFFVYHCEFYGKEGVCVYRVGEIPKVWAILYKNEVEEVVDFGKNISYEEMM